MNTFQNEKELAVFVSQLGGILYLVGGCVRDEFMDTKSHDRDYVITGVDIADIPFEKIVGTSFPVFLVSIEGQKCEVALARTERKHGQGYHGFVFEADKYIPIEKDLGRRDLTINAIAKRVLDGYVIDPHGGKMDIADGILCHTTDAFAEDPLRVYRVARFAARFGFRVHTSTLSLMERMREELKHLSVERVWKEFEKVLDTPNPRRFFEVLKDVGVLNVHFPEVDALCVSDLHDGTVFNHTMNLLNVGDGPLERFGLLVHDFGKGITGLQRQNKAYQIGMHYGHAKVGKKAVESLCDRLKAPNKYRAFGLICSEHHMRIKYIEMRASKLLRLVIDHTPHIYNLLKVSFIDSITRVHSTDEYTNIFVWWLEMRDKIQIATQVINDVDGTRLIGEGKRPGKHFGEVLFQRRVESFKEKIGAMR